MLVLLVPGVGMGASESGVVVDESLRFSRRRKRMTLYPPIATS